MTGEYSLDMILEEVCRLDFEEFGSPAAHRYSLRHRIRINKILSEYAKNARSNIIGVKKINRRFVTAAVVIILLAAMAVTAVAALIINGFIQIEHSDNTQLFVENIENSPTTIEYLYYLPELPQGYEYWDGGVTITEACSIYLEEGTANTLLFTQIVKSEFIGHYNNEGYTVEAIEINGHNGIFIDYSNETQSSSCIVWDVGDYILQLEVLLPKNEAIKLAESAKFS